MNLPDILERRIERDPNSGCWLWNAGTNGRGYGRVSLLEHENPDGFEDEALLIWLGPVAEHP